MAQSAQNKSLIKALSKAFNIKENQIKIKHSQDGSYQLKLKKISAETIGNIIQNDADIDDPLTLDESTINASKTIEDEKITRPKTFNEIPLPCNCPNCQLNTAYELYLVSQNNLRVFSKKHALPTRRKIKSSSSLKRVYGNLLTEKKRLSKTLTAHKRNILDLIVKVDANIAVPSTTLLDCFSINPSTKVLTYKTPKNQIEHFVIPSTCINQTGSVVLNNPSSRVDESANSTQKEIPTTNNTNQEATHKHCGECFRCSIANTLDKYNTANQEHQKCVNNTPFSHATDIKKKRKIQSQRQPLKNLANDALVELNAIIGNFPHVIPDPHPKQCYLKINPTDDLVRYKSIDGKFIELNIPYECSNPSENIKSVDDLGISLPSITESSTCFHCEIKTPLQHFKSFHSKLVTNGQKISSTKQQLKLSGGRKALPKSKRREFNKLMTTLSAERKSFLDSIELYQKEISDVLSRFAHINPLPHPTSSQIATLKGKFSFSYTDVNNNRIRLTIPQSCQKCAPV